MESRRARQFQLVSKAMVPFTSDILKGIVTGDELENRNVTNVKKVFTKDSHLSSLELVLGGVGGREG